MNLSIERANNRAAASTSSSSVSVSSGTSKVILLRNEEIGKPFFDVIVYYSNFDKN